MKHLRYYLMDNVFIMTLSELLQSNDIEVSYFAAGIVAHLISDNDLIWSKLEMKQVILSFILRFLVAKVHYNL